MNPINIDERRSTQGSHPRQSFNQNEDNQGPRNSQRTTARQQDPNDANNEYVSKYEKNFQKKNKNSAF